MLNKITYIAIACLIPGLSFAVPAGQVSINPVCAQKGTGPCEGAIQLVGCKNITADLGNTCFKNPDGTYKIPRPAKHSSGCRIRIADFNKQPTCKVFLKYPDSKSQGVPIGDSGGGSLVTRQAPDNCPKGTDRDTTIMGMFKAGNDVNNVDVTIQTKYKNSFYQKLTCSIK